MWRNVSQREYHYICRIEKEGMKLKIICNLTWVILALFIILTATYLNQLSEQERMTDQWMGEGLLSFLDALGGGGNQEGDLDASSAAVVHARERKITGPVDKEIECDTKLILVTDWIEENGKNFDWKELIDRGYERELRVYPSLTKEVPEG